jgi:branched-chain amino acid transport system permease protein
MKPAAAAVSVVALALLPAFTGRTDVLNLAFLVFLYITLAQSWNVLGGLAGQINLGHAAFFGIGAFVTRSLWISGVHPYAGMLAGGVVAMLFGLVIGVPAFRLRGAYFAIGTLGLAEILRITAGNALPEVSTLPGSFIAGYSLAHRYYLALGLAVITMSTVWVLARSRTGLALLALRDDEDAAEATGVNTLKYKLVALAISTALAGLGGGVLAFYHVSYYPQMPFGPTWTFDPLLITFIGGVGTLWGPVLGAVFYILVKEVLARSLVEIHLLVFGVLFIVVVMMLPGGLLEAVRWLRRPTGRAYAGP